MPAERMTENKDICFICFRTVAHPLLPKHTAAPSTETSIGTQEKMAVAQGSADCGPITGSFFRAPSHHQGQDGGLLLNPAKENRSQFSHGPLLLGTLHIPRALALRGPPALGMPHECDCSMERVAPSWSLQAGTVPLRLHAHSAHASGGPLTRSLRSSDRPYRQAGRPQPQAASPRQGLPCLLT